VTIEDITITAKVQGVSPLKNHDVKTTLVPRNKSDFTAVGRFNDINLKPWMESVDIVDAIVSMSKPTQRFFKILKDMRNGSTNFCHIKSYGMNQQAISKAYMELKKGGAVRRVRKDVYMINPDLILVWPDSRRTVKATWDELA